MPDHPPGADRRVPEGVPGAGSLKPREDTSAPPPTQYEALLRHLEPALTLALEVGDDAVAEAVLHAFRAVKLASLATRENF
jgi:hypothetical protein